MYEKSQITISHILDAAQGAFVANNYNDITLTAIAREANVTKGAIYHHFESKEDLFLQVMLRYLDNVQVLLQQAVASTGNSRKRLAKLTALYLGQSLEEQHVIQLVRRDANRFGEKTRQQLITAYQKALPNQVEAIIADGVAADEIVADDARLMAWQFIAIVEVHLSDYARKRFDDVPQMVNHLISQFFYGVDKQSIELRGKNNDTNVY